jgi:hypothetical protein
MKAMTATPEQHTDSPGAFGPRQQTHLSIFWLFEPLHVILMAKAVGMQIFDFDIATARRTYAEQGWIHIPSGMSPDFLDAVKAFVQARMNVSKLDRFAIQGKKEQALFSFPEDTDYPGELFDVVASVCGLNRETMTLSERHIQAYDEHAQPNPQAHKDRFPSQVSVGFSVEIPEGSQLVLYPYDYREVNPFNAASALVASLQPHEMPDVILPKARAVSIEDRPGDVVMFPGSSTWHLRRNSAGTVNLYVKVNDFDCDPLGEDPLTPIRCGRSQALLASLDHGQPNGHIVRLSRRFDFAERKVMRGAWREVIQAAVYGEPPFGISEAGLSLLQRATEPQPFSDLVACVSGEGHSFEQVSRDALLMLERGALELA